MIISTDSSRLARLARLFRFVPPRLSGFSLRLYPPRVGRSENAAFTRKSSLGDVRYQYHGYDWVATGFALRGYFDWANVAVARALCRPGDTIIDVGSNIGTETLLLARLVGPSGIVVAFEPVPANFDNLRNNAERNGLSNIRLHQAAVSDRPGALKFVPPSAGVNTGTGHIALDAQSAAGAIEVQTLVLDRLFEQGAFAAPRLLVMDVQGAEPLVLAGADAVLRAARPAVVLEVAPHMFRQFGKSVEELHDYLSERRYACREITRSGLAPAGVNESNVVNWLCLPRELDEDAALIRRINRTLFWGGWLPPIRGLNPAVIP